MMMKRRNFLGAAVAAPLACATGAWAPAWAQTAPDLGTPTWPSPGWHRVKLGEVEIIALIDGIARRPLNAEFVRNAPLDDVRALLAAQGLPTAYVDIPFTPFLVVAGPRRILIDTGLGEFGGPTTGKLLAHLRAAGYEPGDIDTVLISHFHGDHINGLRNRAGEFVFRRAQVLVPAPEYAFWMDDARLAAAPEGLKGTFNNVRRVFGQMPATMLQRFEPGAELVPGVRSLAAFGHTPGQSLFEVSSGGQTFTFVADLANIPALFARQPDWAVSFDMDAEAARKVRREVFDRLARSGGLMGGFHFPFPALGRMVASGQGYAFEAVA